MFKNLKIEGFDNYFDKPQTYVLDRAVILSMPASGKSSLVKELNRSCYSNREKGTGSFIASDYDFKMPDGDTCIKRSTELIDWMMTTSFNPIKILCTFPSQFDPKYLSHDIPIVVVLPDSRENLAIRSWVRFLSKRYGNAKDFPLSFTKLTVELTDVMDAISREFDPHKDISKLIRQYKSIVRNGLKYCSFNEIDEFNRRYLYYYYDWLYDWWKIAINWQCHYDGQVIISELKRGKYLSELFTFSFMKEESHE